MNNKFGELLYQLRKEKGLTQSELAQKLGITNKAVSKWETGDSFPETSLLIPLSNIFNISVDELLKGERDINTKINIDEEPVIEDEKVMPYKKSEVIGVSLAIGIILIGVMLLIVLSLTNISYGIYVSIFIGLVAVGVFLLTSIYNYRVIKSYEDMDKDTLYKGKKIVLCLSIGIALTIMSVIPLISLESAGFSTRTYLIAFFAVLIVSVPLIIGSGILLEEFNKNNYNKKPKSTEQRKKDKLKEIISGVIMLTSVAIYLFVGFVFDIWHPSWVVFVIGGILCGIVDTILSNNSVKSKK